MDNISPKIKRKRKIITGVVFFILSVIGVSCYSWILNNRNRLLFSAVESGSLKRVRILLFLGASPDKGYGEHTPFLLSIVDKDYPIFLELLERGADPYFIQSIKISPMGLAIHEEAIEIVKKLSTVIDVNKVKKNDVPSICQAVIKKNWEVLNILINAKANQNANCAKNMTPLHLAAVINFKPGYDLLLSKGADENLKDDLGRTPIDILKEKNK